MSWFSKTPLSALVNGAIGVQYFFVLTGFLVARSSLLYHPDNVSYRKKIFVRYFRLLPMILLATVFTFFCMKFGLQGHLNIADSTLNPEFYKEYCNFYPSLKSLLINSFIKPFIISSDYVGPFWTIKYEFLGYVLCQLLYWMFGDSRVRRLVLLAAMILAYLNINITVFGSVSIKIDAYYIEFFLGAFVADLYYDRRNTSGLLSKYYNRFVYKKNFAVLSLVFGIYLVCCPMYFSTIYAWIGHLNLDTATVRGIGWSLVIYFFLQTPKSHKMFEGPVLEKLGSMSYAIYAFHWPIMLVVLAGSFGILARGFSISYNVAAILSFLITLPIIYLVSLFASKTEIKLRNIAKFKHNQERN